MVIFIASYGLADFQTKFYVREEGHSFLFFYEGGSSFLQFSSMGGH